MDSTQEEQLVKGIISDIKAGHHLIDEDISLSENALVEIAVAHLEFSKNLIEIIKRRLNYPDTYLVIASVDEALSVLSSLLPQAAEIKHHPTPTLTPKKGIPMISPKIVLSAEEQLQVLLNAFKNHPSFLQEDEKFINTLRDRASDAPEDLLLSPEIAPKIDALIVNLDEYLLLPDDDLSRPDVYQEIVGEICILGGELLRQDN